MNRSILDALRPGCRGAAPRDGFTAYPDSSDSWRWFCAAIFMFSLRNKLFLAFLLSSALLAVSMLALFQWSFDRGFLNYIQRVDQKRLEVIGSALEQKLAQTPDWQALLQPGAAEQLMDGVRDFPRHGPGQPEFNGPLPPPPPDHFHAPPPRPHPRFRFFILDAN